MLRCARNFDEGISGARARRGLKGLKGNKMGLGKKLKKAIKKIGNGAAKVVRTGVSAGLNTVSGGLFHAAGGDDLLKAGERHVTGESADDKREEKIDALRQQEKADEAYRNNIAAQKDYRDDMAEQSRKDYAGMGGLIGDGMGGGMVGYKKKKYGLIGR